MKYKYLLFYNNIGFRNKYNVYYVPVFGNNSINYSIILPSNVTIYEPSNINIINFVEPSGGVENYPDLIKNDVSSNSDEILQFFYEDIYITPSTCSGETINIILGDSFHMDDFTQDDSDYIPPAPYEKPRMRKSIKKRED